MCANCGCGSDEKHKDTDIGMETVLEAAKGQEMTEEEALKNIRDWADAKLQSKKDE